MKYTFLLLLFGNLLFSQQLNSLKSIQAKYDSLDLSHKNKYQQDIVGKSDEKVNELYYSYLKDLNANRRERKREQIEAVKEFLNSQKLVEATNLPENKQATEKAASYSLGFPALYKEVHDFIAKSYKNPDYPLSLSAKIHFIVQNDNSLYIEKVEGTNAEFNDIALLAFLMAKGNWETGEQLGRPVKVKFILPVKFIVEE